MFTRRSERLLVSAGEVFTKVLQVWWLAVLLETVAVDTNMIIIIIINNIILG